MLLADSTFRIKRFFLGANRVRRTRLYCVGMGKTGTHSIAGMFSKNVRAAHEIRAMEFVERFFDWREGRITENEMAAWVRARDRELALEVDSSPTHIYILDFFLREFPGARFVLPVRDCYSWLESVINHDLYFHDIDPRWLKMRALLNDSASVHAPEEKILQEKGLYTLDCYFAYWNKHNREVLDKVPTENLLIIRTEEIKKRAYEIADFAGLPRYSIQLEQTHQFKNPKKLNILREIDPVFLQLKAEKHCHELMQRFFPEIKSPADAKL